MGLGVGPGQQLGSSILGQLNRLERGESSRIAVEGVGNFSLKGQRVNVSDSISWVISNTAPQLCGGSMPAATDTVDWVGVVVRQQSFYLCPGKLNFI